MCGCLHEEVGLSLESPNQKTRVLLVFITLSCWFSKHVHKVFGEILVRT
jgi:hypothetical protein